MTSLPYLLSDTARLLRRAFDARVRQLGMTSSQARLLLILSHTEGENQAFYADRLEVEPISLCRLVDRMVESGRIERRPDPADRRAWRVYLTAAGHQIIDQVMARLSGLEDEMLAGMDEAQRASLGEALAQVQANFLTARTVGATAHG